MSYSRIAGTGSYLPDKVVTNHDLEKVMDTTDEWIQERTGIKRRHVVADNEKTSDIGLEAGRRAMAMADIQPDELDLIVVATTTPDKVFPATACIIQRRLEVGGFGAFDVQAACSGFVFALDTADRFIRTGAAKNALVIGAETLSRITNWEDRTTAVLFGDGAGAVVLQASDEPGVMSTHIHADGQYEDLLEVPAGVSSGFDDVRAGNAYIQMNGNAVFRRAVATLDSIGRETLEANGVDKHDIDWLVPHQANILIMHAACDRLGIDCERAALVLHRTGNTSSASIPLALVDAIDQGRLETDDLVLLAGFGAGMTWGSALLRWQEKPAGAGS